MHVGSAILTWTSDKHVCQGSSIKKKRYCKYILIIKQSIIILELRKLCIYCSKQLQWNKSYYNFPCNYVCWQRFRPSEKNKSEIPEKQSSWLLKTHSIYNLGMTDIFLPLCQQIKLMSIQYEGRHFHFCCFAEYKQRNTYFLFGTEG